MRRKEAIPKSCYKTTILKVDEVYLSHILHVPNQGKVGSECPPYCCGTGILPVLGGLPTQNAPSIYGGGLGQMSITHPCILRKVQLVWSSSHADGVTIVTCG